MTQCRSWLAANLPNARLVPANSNAVAPLLSDTDAANDNQQRWALAE